MDAVMFDCEPNAPFVERLTGFAAQLFAWNWLTKMANLPMPSYAWADTAAHWSLAALEQRRRNRKIYFDTKYPDRPKIIVPGDKLWPN